MKYRREIDGLRALAVLPVILFHAGFEMFSGGFVGVDVFFVISGYLITAMLIEDIEKQRFSIANFYERRARRLLPALFCVLLVCIPFAWMWMTPQELKVFSQSLVAVSVFISNIFFWRQSDYFDPIAEGNPLLHTWSLAVEEQFYLLFPIFLILSWRFGKKVVFGLILFLVAISLGLSEWGWRNSATANFYLAPTRAWELFAGSVAALIAHSRGTKRSDPLAFSGLLAIIFAIFWYDESTPFPSAYALVPVIGVVLLILYADEETCAAKLLSMPAFVGVGLVSYSAYLWHQPLVAFLQMRAMQEPSQVIMMFLVIGSLVLGYLSWKYVEQPFRDKAKFERMKVFAGAVAGTVLFISIGFIGNRYEGFPERMEHHQLEILQWEQYRPEVQYREGVCFLRKEQTYNDYGNECTAGDAELLVWGDSHAAALASGLRHIAPVDQLTASACPPILNRNFASRPNCKDNNAFIEETIALKKYTSVILHANWKNRSAKDIDSLVSTILRLKYLGVNNIYVVGGVPQYFPSLPRRLLLTGKEISKIDQVRYPQDDIRSVDNAIYSKILNTDAIFLSLNDILCRENNCRATHKHDGIIYPIAWDYGHLTEGGARYIATELIQLISHEKALR